MTTGGKNDPDGSLVSAAIGGDREAFGELLTHAEAAEILGVAEATVSWRMHEVRRMLGSSES